MEVALVKGGRLIDGTGRPPIEGGAILVEQGRIKAVGRRAEIAAAPGAAAVDRGAPRIMEKPAVSRRRSPETFGFALESGLRFAPGTASMHGLAWFEAQKAVEFGASHEAALAGVTRNAAEAIRLLDEVGTLQAGKRADIVSLRGDPLRDIAALREVGLIRKDGRRYDTISRE